MPQLGPWRNGAQGNATDGRQPPGGLLDPASHPTSAISGGYQPINGANVADGLREALLQADTVARSAANILSFGQADKAEAAADAFMQGGPDGWSQRFQAELAQQHARDAYDAGHRRTAQVIGDGIGVGIGLASPVKGPAVARIAGAAGLTVPDAAAILGAGAATGVAGQRVADLATGRSSSWQNDLGAGFGGAVGAGALFLGPQRASAIGGAVTSATQDVLNGRSISLDDAAQGAADGGLLGRVGGASGEQWSDGLSPRAKGQLGEALGSIRSTVNGLRREWSGKAKEQIPGTNKWWFPDGRSGDVRFEDKFGPSAKLSKNQKLAQPILGDNFWINHFLPEDVGKAASVPVTAAAPFLTDQSPDQ